jgi:hypothetical protein
VAATSASNAYSTARPSGDGAVASRRNSAGEKVAHKIARATAFRSLGDPRKPFLQASRTAAIGAARHP